MVIDTLTSVDMKETRMLEKKKVKAVCDNLCQAAKLRDETLFKAALHGPRI
jgi:hypothetical protein